HSPPALSTTPVPRTRTCEPNSYGARYELGTQLRVGAPGTRRPTRPAHPTLTPRTQHRPRPANSYPRAELVRCTLRARHPATSRRTRHSPPDPPGAPDAHRPHSAPRPSRELVPASRTRTAHATSSAPSYESAHPALAARPDRRARRVR